MVEVIRLASATSPRGMQVPQDESSTTSLVRVSVCVVQDTDKSLSHQTVAHCRNTGDTRKIWLLLMTMSAMRPDTRQRNAAMRNLKAHAGTR